jgi:hypothetical protein
VPDHIKLKTTLFSAKNTPVELLKMLNGLSAMNNSALRCEISPSIWLFTVDFTAISGLCKVQWPKYNDPMRLFRPQMGKCLAASKSEVKLLE